MRVVTKLLIARILRLSFNGDKMAAVEEDFIGGLTSWACNAFRGAEWDSDTLRQLPLRS